MYRCSRTDAQFKEVKKLVVVVEGWKWLLECLTKNDLAKKHNNEVGEAHFYVGYIHHLCSFQYQNILPIYTT